MDLNDGALDTKDYPGMFQLILITICKSASLILIKTQAAATAITN